MNKIAALWAALLAASMAVAAPAGDFSGGTLTNADIIGYAHSNISPSLIISRIHTSNTAFDLSDNAMTILRQNGVTEEVLEAMRSTASTSLSLGRVPAVRDLTVVQQPVPQAPPPVASSASVESRYETELANLVEGGPETKRTATAWMLANRDRTLPLLRKSLDDAKPDTQAAALGALGALKDRENIVQMRRLLAGSSPKVRESAALALAELEDSEAIAASEKVLSQPLNPLDGYIRLVGAARLVRAAGDLAKILSDNPSVDNRVAAAWSLAEIGRSGSVAWPALEHALIDDSDPRVRREAVRAVASFHDDSSARLLQDACRRDPEVRKITLQAMADYPETVAFLVEVMNRGTDQIAADELEAARASLRKLTGEDMGLDGQRWTAWYSDNKSRFPALAPAMARGSGERARDTDFLDGLTRGALTARSGSGQSDIADYGVLMDSSLIPMAPEVDGSLRSGLGGIAGGSLFLSPSTPPGAGGTTASPEAIAPSPGDFADWGGGSGSTATAGSASGAYPGATESGDTFLKTWSSEPGGAAGGAQSSAGAGAPFGSLSGAVGADAGAGQTARQQPYAYSFGQEPAEEPDFAAQPSPAMQPSSSSLLPSAPVVSPLPAEPAPAVGASGSSGLSGISLPLGGLLGASTGSSTPPSAAPAPTPTPEPALSAPPPMPAFDSAATPAGGSPFADSDSQQSPFPAAALSPQGAASDFPGGGDDLFGEAFSSPFPGDDAFSGGSPDADFVSPDGAAETAGVGESMGYDDSDPFAGFDAASAFDAPQEALSAETGLAPALAPEPTPSASVAPPPTGDYNVIAFPDDDSFGLGGSYFDDQPAPSHAAPPAHSSSDSEEGTASLDGMNLSLPGMGESAPPAGESSPPPVAPPPTPSTPPPPPRTGVRPPAPTSASMTAVLSDSPTVVGGVEIPSTIRFAEPRPGQVVEGENILGYGDESVKHLKADEYVVDDFPPGGYGTPPRARTMPLPQSQPASPSLRPSPATPIAPPASAGEDTGAFPSESAPKDEFPYKPPLKPGEVGEPMPLSPTTGGQPEGEGLVSELWDGPEEFYQNLDELEGVEEYTIIGTSEPQVTKFVGPDVDFTEVTDTKPAAAPAPPPEEAPAPAPVPEEVPAPAAPPPMLSLPDAPPAAEAPKAEPQGSAESGGGLRLQIPPM